MISDRHKYLHINFADKLNLSAGPMDLAPMNVARKEEADSFLRGEDREFLTWLLECAGVDFAHYRPESLARRLPACLRTLRANSIAHARAILDRDRRLTADAVNAVLIGVTSFFRDERVFADLDELVLSQFVDRASVRIWSVGCSDGMELYSVAIQLAERRSLHRCHLLGTDCRAESTRIASAGAFARQAVARLPDVLCKKYFTPAEAGSMLINPIIRSHVQWRTADVMARPEPGPWDLILCRNMAMYMRSEAMTKLWATLQDRVRPGGFLVLGKAERPHAGHTGHTGQNLSMIAPCIFRRDK